MWSVWIRKQGRGSVVSPVRARDVSGGSIVGAKFVYHEDETEHGPRVRCGWHVDV
jgi:hypothetical protein